ncbi:MAG: shikimate kinase [Elusimicrobiota bacterium]
MNLSLIGFTGTGKTEIGRLLAHRMECEFFDLDETLEAKANQSVSEFLKKYGVEKFRDMETEVLAEILTGAGPFIIATGGGTLIRPANRTRLKNSTTAVWLKAKPETIWSRVQDKPYVAPIFFTRQDPLMAIRIEMSRRELHYEEASHWAIDVDGKAPCAVAEEIKKRIEVKT